MQYSEAFSFPMPQLTDDADITKVSDAISMIDAEIYKTREMDAEKYDPTHTYNTGDVVWNLESLWKCKEDNVTGTWDATKWDAKTLAELIAEAGGMSPITAEAEGNPIEITDGASAPMVRCETEIQGSQDLHGYDKPWVGGSGKNKLPLVLSDIKSANTVGTWNGNVYSLNGVTVTVNTDNADNVLGFVINNTTSQGTTFILKQFDISVGNYIVNLPSSSSFDGSKFSMAISGLGSTKYIPCNNATNIEPSSTTTIRVTLECGSGVTFNNLTVQPMIRLSTETDPTFEPYSNICPISGFSEVDIDGCGKNWLVNDFEQGAINASLQAGKTYSELKTSSSTRIRTTDIISLNPVKTYTISCDFTKYRIVAQPYDENGLSLVPTSPFNEWKDTAFQITNTYNVSIAIKKISESNIVPSEYEDAKPQIEIAMSATDYEPYTPNSYTISLGSTRYGGTLDVVRGVLRVTHGYVALQNSGWSHNSAWANECSFVNSNNILSGIKPISGFSTIANVITNAIEATTPSIIASESGACGIGIGNGTDVFISLGKDYNTTTKLIDYLTNNPIYVCYELATPLEVSLTPTAIRSLLGSNYLSCNTGDMEIEYYTQDWQKIIDLIEKESGDKHTYSTSEKVVGTWIDGKDVYEKTIDITSYDGERTEITVTGMTKLLKAEAFGIYNGTQYMTLPYYYDGADYVRIYGKPNTLVFQAGPTYRNDYTESVVTIQYTKSS